MPRQSLCLKEEEEEEMWETTKFVWSETCSSNRDSELVHKPPWLRVFLRVCLLCVFFTLCIKTKWRKTGSRSRLCLWRHLFPNWVDLSLSEQLVQTDSKKKDRSTLTLIGSVLLSNSVFFNLLLLLVAFLAVIRFNYFKQKVVQIYPVMPGMNL